MNEAAFSCTFRVYNSEGEVEQLTVRGETAEQFAENRRALEEFIRSAGYTWKPPQPKTGQKTERILGYVVGEKKDRSVCVHLYAPGRKFKAYTLYAEDKHLFPKPWPTKSEWPGAAPEYEDALARNVFHPLEFDLPVEPILDPEGNPIRNDSGYIRYRPARGAKQEQQAPAVKKPSAIVQYNHKRKLPVIDAYADDQIGFEAANEPEREEWWHRLTASEQDVLMYGRTFLASYKKAPASQHGVKVWEQILERLAEMTGVSERALNVYVHEVLAGASRDPNTPPMTGVVQWLAECMFPTKAKGDANPHHDPDWTSAFAAIVEKVYRFDSEGVDDGEIAEMPF